MPVILAHRRLRQEDVDLETNIPRASQWWNELGPEIVTSLEGEGI